MRKGQITKITLYESICNLGSSTLSGFIIGVIAAIVNTGLFMMMLEIPFTL